MISRDGIAYLETARQFAAGDPAAIQRHTAPGFPLLVSLVGRGVGVSETEAICVAAACGVVSVIGLALLAHQWGGAVAARLAACLVAFLPLQAELGGEILSEPLLLATLPLTLLAFTRLAESRTALAGAGWGLAAGLAGGVGYLARPEGILVLVAGGGALLFGRKSVPWRRRARDVFWLAWPALLVVGAFMIAIRGEAVLGGSQADAWKLTLKRNLGYHLSQLTFGTAFSHLVEQVRRVAQAFLPALGFGLALWFGRARSSSTTTDAKPGEGSLVGRLLLGTALALLLAYVAIRPDRRYAAPLTLLLAPFLAGAGARWLRGASRGERRTRLVLLLVPLLGASLILTLRPRRAAKASYRLAGEALKRRGARRVLAHDSRAAYYGDAEPLQLLWLLPDTPRAPKDLARVARELGADVIVLVVERPEDRVRADGLGAILARPGVPIQADGGVPLRLFWVVGE